MAVRKSAAKHEKTDISPDSGNYVAALNRNEDGSPDAPEGFRLLLLEGASDLDKAQAWNNGGELPPEDIITYIPKPHV